MDQLTSKTRLVPYRSPVRPVLHAGEPLQPFSAQTLQRARKKLLAELALSNDELQLDGLPYTRNDLSVLFQDMTEAEWSGHCLIYSVDGLLQFLERSRFDAEAMAPVRPYRYKPGFVAFVSPWFGPAFLEASGRYLRESEPLPLVELFRFSEFIAPEDQHDAFARLRIYFDELGFLLRNWTWEKMQQEPTRINCLFDPDWITFLNALPDALAAARDTVVEQFLGIVYRLQHKAPWKLLQRMCAQLQKIHCNAELRAQVDEYESIMRRNTSAVTGKVKPESSSGGGFRIGQGIWAIIWVFFMIVRAASTDSCNKRPEIGRLEYTPTPAYSPTSDEISAEVAEQATSISNESRLRHAFLELSAGAHSGNALEPATGTAPFTGMSTVPKDERHGYLTVRNETSQDMVLFAYDPKHFILSRRTPVQSVYIRSGEEYEVPLRPNQGYLNAAFGKGWVQLTRPKEVMLTRHTPAERSARPSRLDVSFYMPVQEYFARPAQQLQFLKRDLMVKDHQEYQGPDALASPVYEPKGGGSDRGTLTFLDKGNKIAVKGGGGLHIYLSVERP